MSEAEDSASMNTSSNTFVDIGSAILDEHFPGADLALRRGRHIDRDDTALYQYLVDAQEVLEALYKRFGCELVHRADGYFYLLPTSDQLGKRHLSVSEMIVGQGLALLYLEPRAAESGGVVTWEAVVSHLASVMGTDALVGVFNPKKKRLDERVAQQTVRSRTQDALRKLAAMGFLEALSDGRFRLRASLMRFAEPVRGEGAPEDELRKLVQRGEVVLQPLDGAADDEDDTDEEGAADVAGRDDTGGDASAEDEDGFGSEPESADDEEGASDEDEGDEASEVGVSDEYDGSDESSGIDAGDERQWRDSESPDTVREDVELADREKVTKE